MRNHGRDMANCDWLVVAMDGDLGRDNRCFTPGLGQLIAGAGLFAALAEEATSRGAVALTLDCAIRAIEEGAIPREIHLVSDMGFGLKSTVGQRASRRTLFCLESPLQSKGFHFQLSNVSHRFDSAYLFGGLAHFSRARRTQVAYFPVFNRCARVNLPKSNEREFLVAICGRKSAYAWSSRTVFGAWRAILRDLAYLALRQVHPILRAPDFYQTRRRVILELAEKGRIRVYGRGWEDLAKTTDAWAGSNDYSEKFETLSKYRFCLCFENCGFPGYITEKIYDCFLAGTIPVYLGAPDVSDRFPPDSYVDYRRFGSPEKLLAYLDSLDTTHLEVMRMSGVAVLNSAEFMQTDPRQIARKLLE